MKNFTFIATAKNSKTAQEKELFPKLEKLGVWTDGLCIQSEYEKGDYTAFRFIEGKTYEIKIQEIQ